MTKHEVIGLYEEWKCKNLNEPVIDTPFFIAWLYANGYVVGSRLIDD